MRQLITTAIATLITIPIIAAFTFPSLFSIRLITVIGIAANSPIPVAKATVIKHLMRQSNRNAYDFESKDFFSFLLFFSAKISSNESASGIFMENRSISRILRSWAGLMQNKNTTQNKRDLDFGNQLGTSNPPCRPMCTTTAFTITNQ